MTHSNIILHENTYCLIFLNFFRGDVKLVSSVIVAAEEDPEPWNPLSAHCYCLCLPWSDHGSPCNSRLWRCDINLLCIRDQPNARRLAPEILCHLGFNYTGLVCAEVELLWDLGYEKRGSSHIRCNWIGLTNHLLSIIIAVIQRTCAWRIVTQTDIGGW